MDPALPLDASVALQWNQTTTGSDGLFTLPLLPPGTYSLQAERQGFSIAEVNGIELPVAGQMSHDIILQVGGVRETVVVAAPPPAPEAQWPSGWFCSAELTTKPRRLKEAQ